MNDTIGINDKDRVSGLENSFGSEDRPVYEKPVLLTWSAKQLDENPMTANACISFVL